jgi:hypothetical protein
VITALVVINGVVLTVDVDFVVCLFEVVIVVVEIGLFVIVAVVVAIVVIVTVVIGVVVEVILGVKVDMIVVS